ncbi:MAG TPA: EAL domain-containing protein [Burkholderiales bacterium]|nr:EAL domain-containing protein [Burkholderiales bacterium]
MAWIHSALLLGGLTGGLVWLGWSILRARRQAGGKWEALRDSEARFRSLIELSADWYWEQDEQQRFTFLSAEADTGTNLNMSTLGLTRRQLPGIDLESADWNAHEETCRARQPFRDFVYRRITPDGAAHWIRTSGEPWYDSRGTFRGYRGVGTEITQQRRADQEIVRLKDMYAALSRTNRAIVRIHEPTLLFDEVCRVAVEYGHLCLAWIGLVDENGWIVPQSIHGPVSDVYRRMRVSVDPDRPEGRGFAGAAVRENRSYIVNDFLAEPRVAPWKDQAKAAGVKSLATFPLRRGGRCIGVLNVHGDEIGFFTDELAVLLEEMVANLSFALDNMQREAEREASKRALHESEEKFRQLAANAPEIFWTASPQDNRITYVSPAYEKIFGRSASALMEDTGEWVAAIHPEDRQDAATAVRLSRTRTFDQDYRIVRPDGEVRWLHTQSFPVIDEHGRLTLITGISEDVTSRKLDEQRLQHLAHYDSLTELPNRALFLDRLQQSVLHARRERRAAAVVFVDVDHFKRINDTLGHAAGDALLRQVARRLESAVRAGDTVGRLGGDEFALILCNLANAQDAGLVAQKLMGAMRQPFNVEGSELFVSASAGVTLFPDDSEDPDTLMKNADIAMYRSKELGRDSCQFFKSEMNAKAVERLSMETHLRRALERGEFTLHYQPKVNIASGEIVGLEALLRWHPESGMVSPARFIPILEDNGLILPVGEWVLAEVCRQLNAWKADRTIPVVPVAVNLSGRQLQQKDVVGILTRIISRGDLNPGLIEFEITESMLMRNAEQAGDILRELQQFGVCLSMDDFGTGYSSLGNLKSFPLDTLKIDRSFVRDIVTDPDDAMITRAIISMAHSLRMKVVAEGVENAAQLALLARAGCDEIQGFHFSRPLPADACAELVRERRLPRAQSGASGPTLLIVDDDRSIVALFEALLRHERYRILTAVDADRALEALAANQIDVVLADQNMPGMSGVELLRRIKGLYPETVRIMISGEIDAQVATEAINQGAVYRVLNKSISHDQLRASLREAFAHKALQDENLVLANKLRAMQAAASKSPSELAKLDSGKG